MALKLSKRSDIPVFRVLDILRTVNERVEAGEDIVHLEVGQPCVGAPPEVLEHIKEIMDQDPCLGYTEALGLPMLRERISDWYRTYYNLDVPKERIAVTVGASGGFILSFLSIFEPGDKVAMAIPGYPPYRGILKSLGMIPVEIPTSAKTNYQPTLEDIKKHGTDLKGLILTSPSNPTGTLICPVEFQKIVTYCEQNNIWLISDELYHGITFGERAQSALSMTQNAIIVNSFSKYFAMTGWRLGWLVLPENVVDRVKRLAESLFISAPCISQHAAYKIFDHVDILDQYVARYAKNLALLKKELPLAGIDKISNTKGAFYLYADIHHLTNDAESFCRKMLDEAHIACTPGIDFDPVNGNGTVRISFAGSERCISLACERLHTWLQKQPA
jgi:aspartate/methionine/tyrosine aminotransferase